MVFSVYLCIYILFICMPIYLDIIYLLFIYSGVFHHILSINTSDILYVCIWVHTCVGVRARVCSRMCRLQLNPWYCFS